MTVAIDAVRIEDLVRRYQVLREEDRRIEREIQALTERRATIREMRHSISKEADEMLWAPLADSAVDPPTKSGA